METKSIPNIWIIICSNKWTVTLWFRVTSNGCIHTSPPVSHSQFYLQFTCHLSWLRPNYWLVMSSRLLQAWAGAGGLKTSFRWNWPPVKLVQRNQRPPKNDRSSFLNVTTYLAHGAACHSQFSSKSKLLTDKNDKASQYRNLPIIAVSMAGVTSAACSTVARTIRVHLVAWHPSSLPNQSWAQKLSLFTAELLWPPSHLADWLVPTGLRTAHSRVTHTPPPPPSLPVFCTL